MENIIYKKKGLSGGTIKIIALLFMLLDHLHYFLTPIGLDIPIWFTWLGRIVAPLFVYMTVEGYSHTRDKIKYSKRLYLAYVIMTTINGIVPKIFTLEPDLPIMNSMFGTLFLLVIYLSFVDRILNGIEDKKFKEIFTGIIYMILPIVINLVVLSFFFGEDANILFIKLIMTFIPLPFFVEGGINFIVMGILFYLFRKNKNIQILVYIFSCMPYLLSTKFNINTMLYSNYQWMMMFSAIFIYFYNGEKGRNLKWLFYIFYPLHIYIIYILAWFIQNR